MYIRYIYIYTHIAVLYAQLKSKRAQSVCSESGLLDSARAELRLMGM